MELRRIAISSVAQKRMQRFGMILERFISPEGAFPVFGRSITYRTGTLQPLGFVGMAWMVAQGIVERTGTCCHDSCHQPYVR
mgnify:CR=1 FL=1